MIPLLARYKAWYLRKMLARLSTLERQRENERSDFEEKMSAAPDREERAQIAEVRDFVMSERDIQLKELKRKILNTVESLQTSVDLDRILSAIGIGHEQLRALKATELTSTLDHDSQSGENDSSDKVWTILGALIIITVACFVFSGVCSLNSSLSRAGAILKVAGLFALSLTLIAAAVQGGQGMRSIWDVGSNRSLCVRVVLTVFHVIYVVVCLMMLYAVGTGCVLALRKAM